MIFCLKLCIVATPPPVDLELTAQSSLEDWDSVCKGEDSMNFDTFYLQLFQFTDMWVSTCLTEDYVNMMLRILDDITVGKSGKLQFKGEEAIHFSEPAASESERKEQTAEHFGARGDLLFGFPTDGRALWGSRKGLLFGLPTA